jgi:hypothetical protein
MATISALATGTMNPNNSDEDVAKMFDMGEDSLRDDGATERTRRTPRSEGDP